MIDTNDILVFTGQVGDWLPVVRDDHKLAFLNEAHDAIHNSIDQGTDLFDPFWTKWDALLDLANANNVRITDEAGDMSKADGLGA